MTRHPSPARPSAPEDSHLAETLARRFHADAADAVAAHPVIALLLAGLVWQQITPGAALLLVGLVTLGAVVRVALHRRAARYDEDPRLLLRWTRHATSAQALAWGVAAVLVVPSVPSLIDARILLVCVGLVAGALATHRADPAGFRRFTALILVPTGLVMGVTGTELFALDALLIPAFWLVMDRMHRRTWEQLCTGVDANLKLQESVAAATREQDFTGAVLAGVPDAMVVIGPDGYVSRSSHEFQRLVGLTEEEVQNQDPAAASHDLLWRHLHRLVDQARHLGRVEEEVRVQTAASGQTRTLRMSAACASGAATGWVVAVLEDLTQIREAEDARHQAEADYEDLVQSAHDLIWKMDPELRWTYLNAAAGEIYGGSPVDLLGTSALDRARPDCRTTDEEALRRVLAGHDLASLETVHRTVSGEERTLSLSARPILDPLGRVSGIQGMARDVTERRAAEEQVRTMARKAELATRMKSAFLANMSHEIRTPMNGVLGMTELLLDTELDAEQRSFLQIIQSSGENLLRLLNEILDFSKIEAGHLELEDIPFDLPRTLTDSVKVLEPLARERGNRLVLEVDPALPRAVSGDPGRLRQVVTNLVSNAVKFTHDGTVTVRARSREDGRRLLVEVVDTGTGIPAEKLEDIFGEFSQADASVTRKFGGTGLGLAICRRLVEMMGGEIRVESEVGRGSTFRFHVRLQEASVDRLDEEGDVKGDVEAEERQDAPAPAPFPGSPAPSRTASPGSTGTLHLLLAEDNPVNRQVALAMLERHGFRVTMVENGADAVGAALDPDAGIDLVLMDVQMPVMDGLEATRIIREAEGERGTRVPILALTAHALPEERARCMAAGMDDFLSKPFRPDDLLALVERWSTGAGSGRGGPGPAALLPADPPASDAPADDPGDPPPVDLPAFRAAMAEAGIEEVVDTMLQLFVEELPGRLAEIRGAMERADLPSLASVAHALKSSSGNVRADGLYTRVRALEAAARAGDGPGAHQGAEDVLQEADRVQRFLEKAS